MGGARGVSGVPVVLAVILGSKGEIGHAQIRTRITTETTAMATLVQIACVYPVLAPVSYPKTVSCNN